MWDYLQNPGFLAFVVAMTILVAWAMIRSEIIPAFLFFVMSAMGVIYEITGMGQISMLKAVLLVLLTAVLIAGRLRARARLPVGISIVVLLYMGTVILSGYLNNVPLTYFRSDMGTLAVAITVSLCPNNEKTLKYLTWTFAIWGIINFGATVAEFAGMGWVPTYQKYRDVGMETRAYHSSGFMGHPTYMGLYYVIALIAAQILYLVSKTRPIRLLIGAAFIVLVMGLFGTLARGALGAWILASLYIQYRARGLTLRTMVTIGSVAIVVMVMSMLFMGLGEQMLARFENIESDRSALERIPLWEQSMTAFIASPVVGNGPGWKSGTLLLQSHNTFIQVLVESGALGLFLFCTLMVMTLRRLLVRSRQHPSKSQEYSMYQLGFFTTVAAILIDGLTHSFDFILPLWMLVGIAFTL